MAGAVIGSLRVDLGMNSAQFQRGLKGAETGMQRIAKVAKVSFAAVGVAAGAAVAALGVAVKGAIDNADELSKTAQAVGTSTEALSRLDWAARLSGVSLDELSGGLERLSRNMLDVSQGAGETAARAFEALGIAVTDADGELRDSSEVLSDVAAQFAVMEDGAAKTGLAMQLFGRSGADLIPMLNQGRDGLAAMAAESDRLGLTISTSTGRAAEKFNDTLTRISVVFQGVVNKIMQAVLPALQNLANTLASNEFAEGAQQIAIAIVNAFDLAAQAIGRVGEALRRMGPMANRELSTLRDQLAAKEAVLSGDGWIWDRESLEKEIVELRAAIAGKLDPDNFDVGASFAQLTTPMATSLEALREQLTAPEGITMIPIIEETGSATAGATSAIDQYAESMKSAGQSIRDSMMSPMEGLAAEMDRLREVLWAGEISWEDFQKAGQMAAANVAADAMTMAGSLAGSLGQIFGDSKELAIAEVLINTASAIMKTFGTQGVNPFSIAAAGVAAAAGAAQLAAIQSTSLGSGGSIKGFANGTNYAPGGLAWVGERGPELMNVPRGSEIMSSEASRALVGGSAKTVIVPMTSSRYTREDGREFLEALNLALADGARPPFEMR